MSDLISRSNLLQEFEKETSIHKESELWHITGIKAFIENEPTAYDVDKVVEQLEEIDCPNCSMYCVDANICGFDEMRKQTIDIIRAGGKE